VIKRGLSVTVGPDGNVEKAMRKFKKKVQDSRLLLELRDRQQFTKPTTKRKLKRNAARARWKKYVESHKLPPRSY
jgi:small subunit ribosomal protein S21